MTEHLGRTARMVARSEAHYERAVGRGVMRIDIVERRGKEIVLRDGRRACEFTSCSYLGLDSHPRVIDAAKRVLDEWGVHLCCARSRLSIEPNRQLEEGLSRLFRGRAITFPSVTSANATVLPLVASGVLIDRHNPPRVCMIFDHRAHASLQCLRPILAAEARLVTIAHNDLDALQSQALEAQRRGETPVFVGDGVYSMGGTAPIRELLELANRGQLHLYLDDAHGTSIFGSRGEGSVLGELATNCPANLWVAFSLAKGFGCNGGGIVVAEPWQEDTVRSFGQNYAFSGPLDFAIMGAALAALDMHFDGSFAEWRTQLWSRVRYFDALRGQPSPLTPIRMIPASSADDAIDMAETLLDAGYLTSAVFYPVVPEDAPQLRVAITAPHSEAQLRGLHEALLRIESAR